MLNNIKDTAKKSLKSETMWFSYALTLFGVIEVNLHLLRDKLGADYYGAAVIIVGITVALLRMDTTKSLKDL